RFEAEHAHRSPGVDVLSSLPDAHGSAVRGGTLTVRFKLERDTRVGLRARAIAPGPNNDSSRLRIDGGDARTYKFPISATWQWSTSNVQWQLPAGEHVLTIEYRE